MALLDEDFQPSQERDQLKADVGDELGAEILMDNSWGKEVALLKDWERLQVFQTDAASLHRLKAEATFVMALIKDRLPQLKDGQDIALVHRTNAVGAKRTEVWALREFRPKRATVGEDVRREPVDAVVPASARCAFSHWSLSALERVAR